MTFSFDISSQTIIFDTIYQSNNEIQALNYSNGTIYWLENDNGEIVVNRIFNNVLESRKLPDGYSSCTRVDGFYAYGDFLYIGMGNNSGQSICNQGFLWGENSFILDTLDIGGIRQGYQNIILTDDKVIVDINSGTKKTLILEDALYRFSPSNVCSLNDSIVNIKAFKYAKSNNERLGQTIIQYDLKDDMLKEIYLSSNFLHFTNEFSIGKSIVPFSDGLPITIA